MAIHHPDQLRQTLMRLHQAHIAVEQVELRTPTLDDVFFELSSWVWVTPRMRENRAGRPLTSGVLGAGEGRNSV
jgi:hypothetical protein